MGDSKVSPIAWAVVSIITACILCAGTVVAATLNGPIGEKVAANLDDEYTVVNKSNPNNSTGTDPITINGINYYANSSEFQCVGGNKSERQTGVNTVREYRLNVPDGWFIVWDAYQGNWTPDDGKFENEGLLSIYGPWQGTVTINTGEYCATLVKWADFARSDRLNGFPIANGRLDCTIKNGLSNPDCR